VRSWLQRGGRSWIATLGVGAALGCVEALLVAATHLELFLSIREFARFTLIAASVAVSLILALVCVFGAALSLLRRLAPERLALGVALLTGIAASPLSAWLFWELTEGRRVRELSFRPAAVCIAALLSAAALMAFALGLLALARARAPKRRVVFVLLMLVAAGWLSADVFVLRRLYPAFHRALEALALICCCGAVAIWPFSTPSSPRRFRAWMALTVIVGLGAPFLLRMTLRAPNLRYAIEQAAPLTGKLLAVLKLGHRPPTAASAHVHTPTLQRVGTQPGIQLRGESILLITIDALRADRLRAYGNSKNLTPELDRFAEHAVVFTRAYTQTPHTSYALGSLFTGKYLRPVLALPGAPREHKTLPRVLRRFGYRTAAFYPPAVFFVDEDRFASLAKDHFGFEYVKEMFAPADERVTQLQEYLAQADNVHPLFVWVHLFEPHEPYDPPARFARGDELEQRYNGEVAAADAAVGDLVRTFRAHAPDATVIITADHGEEFGDHGGYHHGTTLFDEQVRVPLLWSSPGRAIVRQIAAPVQLIDIVPTLLAALGVPRDARMRGADVSALLAGATPDPGLRAFASIDELRMWTDGQHKLICEATEGACRLYDLMADPSESRDVSAKEPALATRLTGELSELVASIPGAEVVSMQSGDAWPKALARARLGDASAGPELLPLLGDERPAVRAEAVRAVAALRLVAALPTVTTLDTLDQDATVRDEAALAALTLGDDGLLDRVQEVLVTARKAGPEAVDLARRAAFALISEAPEPASDTLVELAADTSASHVDRERALRALGNAHVSASVPRVIALLGDVRLRPAVARALGQLGGPEARRALLDALTNERYPEARAAEAEALTNLHERRAKALIWRLLGTETGLPGGLALWAGMGGPVSASRGHLLDLRRSKTNAALRGHWSCEVAPLTAAVPPGCSPSGDAALTFTRGQTPKVEARVLFSVWASGSSEWLRVDDQAFPLRRGRNEIAFAAPASRDARRWSISASAGVRVELVGVVPRSEDIPPPAPEPYEGQTSPEAP
jgi:arylsulfatase A-like enzyme